jgi:hypothetical protein
MQMLLLRSSKCRKDGVMRRVPLVRTRARKFGPVLEERILSVKSDVLVSGPNSCGKTRWLTKFHEKSNEVWKQSQSIYVRSMEPLARWCEDPRVATYVNAKAGGNWDKLKPYERIDALIDWVKDSKAVLVFDDVHKLAGRKLDIAIRMCRAAWRLVIGTFSEQATPITLRMLIETRDPQKISLKSEAAYDVTSVFMWMLILSALIAGWWQLAAIMGGMKVLAGGRRASKQT